MNNKIMPLSFPTRAWLYIRHSPWTGVFLLLFSGLGMNWTAAIAMGSPPPLCPDCHPTLLTVFPSGLAEIAILVLLYYYGRGFYPVRLISQVRSKPCRALVILLTKQNQIPANLSDFQSLPFDLQFGAGKTIHLDGGISNLPKDIVALDPTNWNWQQLMRGLKIHAASRKLKRVILIGSCDTKDKDGETVPGSANYLESAANLVRAYVRPTVVVEIEKNSVDFERFRDLLVLLRSVVGRLEKEKVQASEILIDITGGQKTASIVGAIATLTSRARIQYVSTSAPYKVLTYDVEIQTPPKGN